MTAGAAVGLGVGALIVAGDTVAARCKGFACCQAYQSTFWIMAAGAAVMHPRISRIDQKDVGMTAVAAEAGGIHDGTVIDGRRMHHLKRVGMTSCTVAALAEGLADGQTDPFVGDRMAVAAGAVGFVIIRIDQGRWVAVAVAATG